MLKPRKNYVLVKRDQHTEEVTKGGIHLPPQTLLSIPPRTTGVVVAVGPDVVDLKKGMLVTFPEHAGHKRDYKGIQHLIVEEYNILATFDEGDQVK